MFDEDTMPDWMRTMRGVAPNAASGGGAPAAVTPAAAASVAAPSTAPQFIPVPEGMPPDANQVIYSATYLYYHTICSTITNTKFTFKLTISEYSINLNLN